MFDTSGPSLVWQCQDRDWFEEGTPYLWDCLRTMGSAGFLVGFCYIGSAKLLARCEATDNNVKW